MALGIDISLPEENGAQRQKRMLAEGATIEDVYAAEVALDPAHLRGRGGHDVSDPQQPTEEQLLDALRQIKTEDVVVQTVATLVNLAGPEALGGGGQGS